MKPILRRVTSAQSSPSRRVDLEQLVGQAQGVELPPQLAGVPGVVLVRGVERADDDLPVAPRRPARSWQVERAVLVDQPDPGRVGEGESADRESGDGGRVGDGHAHTIRSTHGLPGVLRSVSGERAMNATRLRQRCSRTFTERQSWRNVLVVPSRP